MTNKKGGTIHVKKGDLLLVFDLNVIKEAGLTADTPVLVTNPEAFAGIEAIQPGDVSHGDIVVHTL